MDKRLLKFNKWNQWFSSQENKKQAYKVFSYWLRIREESKSLSINFDLRPKCLLKNIKDQYVDIKYNKVIKNLSKDRKLSIDEKSMNYIKNRISSLDYSAKELSYMLRQMIYRNIFNDSEMVNAIVKKMNYINQFYKNTKEVSLLSYFQINDIKYNKMESETQYIYSVKADKDNIKLLSSPSWCFLYKDENIDSYFDFFGHIVIFYLFSKESNKFSMYGFNFKKEYNTVGDIINFHNNSEINDDTFDIIRLYRGDSPYISQNSAKTSESLVNRIISVLHEVQSDDFLLGFFVSEIKTFQRLNNIVKSLINKKISSPALKRFFSILKKDSLYYQWIDGGIDCILNNGEISEIELSFIYDFILTSNYEELTLKLLNGIQHRLPINVFRKLYKKNRSIVMQSLYTINHLAELSQIDFNVFKDFNIKEVSLYLTYDRIQLLLDNSILQNDLRTLFFLKFKIGNRIVQQLTIETFNKFSINDREKLLLSNEFSEKTLDFINQDDSINHDKIIDHHIREDSINPNLFFLLNLKFIKKHYRTYLRHNKSSSIVSESTLDKISEISPFDMLPYLTINNTWVLSILCDNIIQSKHPKKDVHKLLSHIKNNKEIIFLLITEFAKKFPREFSKFVFNIKLLTLNNFVDNYELFLIWENIFDRFPTQCLLDTFNNKEIIEIISTPLYLNSYLSISTAKAIIKTTNLLESDRTQYIKYIKHLTSHNKIKQKLDIKVLIIELKKDFINRYGYIKYIKFLCF